VGTWLESRDVKCLAKKDVHFSALEGLQWKLRILVSVHSKNHAETLGIHVKFFS